MNAYYEGTCPKHGKWISRWQNECPMCWDKEQWPPLDIPESTMMIDEERRHDSPLFVWIAPAGEELISMDGLVLSVTRPDGMMIMQFHLPKGMYKSIFVNHPDRTFHYSSDGVLS